MQNKRFNKKFGGALSEGNLKLYFNIREGVQKRNRFFLGISPKQRTPPTHRISLGLT